MSSRKVIQFVSKTDKEKEDMIQMFMAKRGMVFICIEDEDEPTLSIGRTLDASKSLSLLELGVDVLKESVLEEWFEDEQQKEGEEE